MRKVLITCKAHPDGHEVLVDDEDLERVLSHKWHTYHGPRGRFSFRFSISSQGKREDVQLHRFIMNAPKGMDVDHSNANWLDNRKVNLRICTRSQNIWNARKRIDNKSGKKGVTFDKRTHRWFSSIRINNKTRFLGRYCTIEEASEAYMKAAMEVAGTFARES